MSQHRRQRNFTSALRFSFLTPVYDLAIRLFTREKSWRSALVELLDASAGDHILDVGCGTGSLAIALKRREPDCKVIGLDPDPQVLSIAKRKAATAGVEIEWRQGFLDELDSDPANRQKSAAVLSNSSSPATRESSSPDAPNKDGLNKDGLNKDDLNSPGLSRESHGRDDREQRIASAPRHLGGITKVVSSLVLHQTSLEAKRSIMRSAYELLPDGGTFCIADYGVQRSLAMKMMFKLVVQTIDGKQDTQPNANGFLMEGLKEAGFCDVQEVTYFPTLTGSISLISARKSISNSNSTS